MDTSNFTVSIPELKLSEILKLLQTWDNRETCTKQKFQSLLGSLLYISKCVRYSRFFLNRLLQNLRDQGHKKCIKISSEASKDINWFKKFVVSFNGRSIFIKDKMDRGPFRCLFDACWGNF